jgi:hypothetical protein
MRIYKSDEEIREAFKVFKDPITAAILNGWQYKISIEEPSKEWFKDVDLDDKEN